jgi:comEA protein
MKQISIRNIILRVKGWPLALAVSAVLLGAGAAQAQQPPAQRGSQGAVQATAPDGVVNINTASEQELVRLPGIGPSKAQAILDLRKRMGGKFERVESLLRVRGIGRKTLRKLQPMLVLKGETTLAPGKAVRKGGAAKQEK